MCRKPTYVGLVISILMLTSSSLFAQQAVSTLRGTVTDSTQAVVPGVEVVLLDLATNTIARTVVTDGNGNYEMPDLQPGTYRLTAELPGFKTFIADNLVIESAQTRRLDIALEVGESTEEVTVEGGLAVITTEGGSITSGVAGETYKDVPLVDTYPGPLSMLSTLPGIQGDGWVISVAGQQNSQITQANDGVINDQTGSQG